MMTEHIEDLNSVKEAMDEVFIFNIDSNKWIDRPEGIDDMKNLPEEPLNSLNYWLTKLKSKIFFIFLFLFSNFFKLLFFIFIFFIFIFCVLLIFGYFYFFTF